jgi:pSer/pThr/pTyr-binding forkhead associated (FHA) protein
VEVFQRGGQVYARDLGSKNGTILGGIPLSSKTETLWSPNVTMQVGSDQILLVDPVAQALDELERAADEVMPPDEEVPLEDPPSEQSLPPEPAADARAPKTREIAARKPVSAHSGITRMDVFVTVVALTVLGASLSMLFWLLGNH